MSKLILNIYFLIESEHRAALPPPHCFSHLTIKKSNLFFFLKGQQILCALLFCQAFKNQ